MKKKVYDGHMLTEKEKRLMEVLFLGGATQPDISMFVQDMDIDTASTDYMLMLSYLGQDIKWKWFPEEMIPRLRGLYRYYHVRNVMGIKGLLRQIDLLDKAGIPVMLIKGMAIRQYYAPGVPRIMSDMDILVPEEKFEKAVNILCVSGKKGVIKDGEVHIINGIASVDLHRWFFKHHGEKGENIWERAIAVDFYGRRVYVPSPEDMFVHQLDTRAWAIFSIEAVHRRMHWLYDCRNICGQEGFDWNIVANRIKQFRIENTSYFMLKAFSDCFPKILPDSFIEEMVTPTGSYKKWLIKRTKYCKLILQQDTIWKFVLTWPMARYYDYQERRYQVRLIDDGKDLSVAQYIKNRYNRESVFECIKILLKNIVHRVKSAKKGENIG